MKFSSKNSFLKRISCIALSLMLCLTSFTLAGFVPTLEAEAATTNETNVELFHYTFDNYTVNSTGDVAGTLTATAADGSMVFNYAGWNTTAYGSVQSNSDNFHHPDGGIFCDGLSLSGDNWTLTYEGSSQMDLTGTGQSASCEIGLGNSLNNPNIIRVSSHGYVYSNGTHLTTVTLNNNAKNIITFTYNSGKLSINVNGTNYGSFDVDASNVTSLNSGYISGYGSHNHYIYDIRATTYVDPCTFLTKKMKEFEDKLKTGNVYTNISNAYSAYVEASKAYDAFYYGGDTSIQLATYAENLNKALNSMKEASLQTPSADVVPAFNNGNVASGYYSNVLYSNGVSDTDMVQYFSGGAGIWGQNGHYKAKLHTNKNIVLLYDDVNVTSFPITLEGAKQRTTGAGSKSINVKLVKTYVNNNSPWVVNNTWQGAETESNYWPSGKNYMSSTQDDNNTTTEFRSGDRNYLFGSSLKYTGSGNDTSYYEVFDSSNDITLSHVINGGVDEWTGKTHTLSPFSASNSNKGTVYVINYAPIPKAYNNTENKSKLKEVNLYKEGGLQNIADAYSKAVNFNLNIYVNSNSYDVTGAAGQIKSIMDSFNGSVTQDVQSQYPALRNAFDYSGTIPTMGDGVEYSVREAYNGGVNNAFTKKSYENFQEKYEAAQNIMKAVPASGYVNDGFAGEAAKALTAAFNALEHRHSLEFEGLTATCSKCGYSVSSSYEPNGFRITKGNLFDFDAYADSPSATISAAKGAVSVDKENDTITVAGNDEDAYTNYAATGNYFRIPVSQWHWYTISYTPSIGSNQVFAFFSDGEHYLNYNDDSKTWNSAKYSAPANEEFKLTFQAPENCVSVDFRFGVLLKGEICTFSNISFYESDENGNPRNGYEVLAENVKSGANVLSSLNIPSSDKCNASYSMYNKSDKIGTSDTISTNLNITLDTEHVYGDFAYNYPTGETYVSTEDYYTHKRFCSKCGYEETKKCTFTNNGVVDDTATVTCSVCGGTYTLSYEEYNKELIILRDKLADTARYTPASIEAATNAMNDVIANVKKPLTQTEVGALVTELMNAENSLAVNTFTITYNVYVGEDKTALKYSETLDKVSYGESKVLTIPADYQKDYAVIKWTRTIESADSIVGTTTSSLTIIANCNASYNVFIKSTAASTENTKVTATLNNKSNKVVDVAYIDKGTNTVSINGSTITLTQESNTTELTAPSYSFYIVSGFTVNGVTVADGSIVEISDTTVIKPIYKVNERFEVFLDTNVKTNKGETGKVEKGWDERITVTADDAIENTQWLYQYKLSDGSYSTAEVIGYGTTISLQVTQSCKISYTNGQTAQPQVSIDYVSYDIYKAKTITAVGRYYLPKGCTKVKAGVILKTSSKKVGATNTPSWDALTVQDNYKVNNKSGVFEATSFVEGTNQYAINFYSAADYQTMYIGAVAYLTYKDANNEEHTIYSDIATYEYNASTAE